MDPALGEPTNWFALMDLLVPFGVVLVGLVWYDRKLRRARRQADVHHDGEKR